MKYLHIYFCIPTYIFELFWLIRNLGCVSFFALTRGSQRYNLQIILLYDITKGVRIVIVRLAQSK